MVDWKRAVATAARLIQPGPPVSATEARSAVRSLRALAEVADAHVRELTQLTPTRSTPPARVVDRPTWVEANARGMDALLTPVVSQLRARAAKHAKKEPGKVATAVGARVTGVQAGVVLAFLASKVLGQFEIFNQPGGELLLVAPNVIEAERSLGVDPGDFRLWVCLHEGTHRLQFMAVPWLDGYLRERVGALIDSIDLDPKVVGARLKFAVGELAKAARGDESGEGLLALIQGERSRAIMDEITAIMSLVEGHAEYVMDAVGPDVVPSVASIRAKFDHRRQGSGPLDRLVRRLLGLDVKMRQYAEGGAFVKQVVAKVGMTGFNVVWTSPETLPRRAELTDPDAWIKRVHPHHVTGG